MYKYESELLTELPDRQGNQILNWTPTTEIIDRREQLKIKIKSLTAESKIIRHEERKAFGVIREELYLHRVLVVRRHARSAHLAYGFIRGKTLEQMEPVSHSSCSYIWEDIVRLCKKYGPRGYNGPPSPYPFLGET